MTKISFLYIFSYIFFKIFEIEQTHWCRRHFDRACEEYNFRDWEESEFESHNRRDNKRVESRVDTVSSNDSLFFFSFFSRPLGRLLKIRHAAIGRPVFDCPTSRSIIHRHKETIGPLDKLPCCTSDRLEIDLPRPIQLAAIVLTFLWPTDLLGNFHMPLLISVPSEKKERKKKKETKRNETKRETVDSALPSEVH